MKQKFTYSFMITSVVFLLIFTIIATYFPQYIPIERSDSKYKYANELFNKDKIINIEIKLKKDDFEEMQKNAMQEEYYECDVMINGTKYEKVGIRTKGNTSLSHVYSSGSTRFSYKLNFGKYIKDQTCMGLDELALNNLVSDASRIKEYMVYDMFNFIDAKSPLCNMCTLKINGKNIGVYAAIEIADKSFLVRNFGNDYGKLYKPEGAMGGGTPPGEKNGNPPSKPGEQMQGENPPPKPGEQMQGGNPPPMPGEQMQGGNPPPKPGEQMQGENPPPMPGEQMQGENPPPMPGGDDKNNSASLKYIDDDVNSYKVIFENAKTDISDKDKNRLIKSLKNISSNRKLQNSFYIEEQLKYIAVNSFVYNSDGYFGHMLHNYYLYEKDGKLLMLPWDYNLAFGGFEHEDATRVINFPIDEPTDERFLDERPMFMSLLRDEVYLDLYHDIYGKFIDEYFLSGHAADVIDNIVRLTDKYIERENDGFYSYTEFRRAVNEMKMYCDLRAKSVRAQIDGKIGSTHEEQEKEPEKRINADKLDLSKMGMQGGPGGPGDMNRDKK